MKILIVDDDLPSALALRKTLETMGYQVEAVHDGAEAWERVRQGGIELLLSDWMMPSINGLELCRLIRAQPDALYTYIILLTARSGREDRLAGLEAGADDLLAKPVDAGELTARLTVAGRILAIQEQLRAHAMQLEDLHLALERQNSLLAKRASTDGLTGLSNRRHFDESLASALSYAERHRGPLSLVLLDTDHFKAYNDAFGHQAGDQVLRAVAETLRSHSRSHEVVARYGGEEFAVILPETDAADARRIAERLRSAIANRGWKHRAVTASFGVATAIPPYPDAARLVERADRALYHAKARGRDRVSHFLDLVTGPSESQMAESVALS